MVQRKRHSGTFPDSPLKNANDYELTPCHAPQVGGGKGMIRISTSFDKRVFVACGIVEELIMLPVAMAVLTYLGAFFRSRSDLGFEVAALRLQLIVLKRKCPRSRLRRTDRIFWVALRRLWSRWSAEHRNGARAPSHARASAGAVQPPSSAGICARSGERHFRRHRTDRVRREKLEVATQSRIEDVSLTQRRANANYSFPDAGLRG